MASNNQHSNAAAQAAQAGTALMKRLETSMMFPVEIKKNLLEAGLGAGDIAVVAGACVATGIDPRLLAYRHNVAPVIKIMNWIKNDGYVAGEDFHVACYKSNIPIPDEYGMPTEQKAKAPTVVAMPSAARALANMKEDGRLYGKTYHVSTKVLDGDEARAVHDLEAGRDRVYVEARTRVVRATLRTFMAGYGPLDTPGEEPCFYGIFSPMKKVGNGVEEDWLEANKAKDNYSPVDIATKRAQTKAARYVTRSNYPRDNRPVDVRIAALVDGANNRIAALEASGGIQEAFDDGMIDIAVEDAPAAAAVTADKAKTSIMPSTNMATEDEIMAAFSAADSVEIVDVVPAVNADPVIALFVRLNREVDEIENLRGMLYDIRTSREVSAIPPTTLATLYGLIRACGNWEVGDCFAGMDKAEIALRFIVAAGRNDDLVGKPVRALAMKIIATVVKDGVETKVKSYEECYYHDMVFPICAAMNEIMESMAVPA